MTSSPELLVEKPRISSIDLMRGVVMVIMALDHTRGFFHIVAFTINPTDLAQTTPAIFLTRWITHFCAPTFVFLSGTSIRLSLQRKSKKELSRFLCTRGLWLVFLEFTVVRFSFFFNLYYDATVVQVIYTIGMSMIIMSAIIHLKEKIILIAGIVITAGHNLLDSAKLDPGHPLFAFWRFVYQAGPLQIGPGKFFLVEYPVLPWLGIMMLGFSMGQWYVKGFDPVQRQKLMLIVGLGGTLLFLILRGINVYGDPAPWQFQKESIRTLLSFINCSKYPVSLLYTLMTLGPVLIFLSLMEKISIQRWKPVEVFGRVPMFYYIMHFFLIHILAIAVFLIVRHKTFADLNFHFFAESGGGKQSESQFGTIPSLSGYFGGIPLSAGYGLRWVYIAWTGIVLIMYPLCKKYNAYKSSHSHWWLSYL
jgi:uncharacterized membrane protein